MKTTMRFLAVAVLVFVLGACGGASDTSTSDLSENPSTSPETLSETCARLLCENCNFPCSDSMRDGINIEGFCTCGTFSISATGSIVNGTYIEGGSCTYSSRCYSVNCETYEGNISPNPLCTTSDLEVDSGEDQSAIEE